MPTVVVGVDNTDTSLHAARWAASLAAREDSELHIVGAYDASTSNYAPGLVIPQEVVEAIAGEAKDAVTNAASAALEAEPDLRIRTSVGEGDAARTLLEVGKDATAIVIGTRRLGGVKGLLLGSVGVTLAAHYHGRVVVIGGDPGSGPVVVGVGDTPISDDAAETRIERVPIAAGAVRASSPPMGRTRGRPPWHPPRAPITAATTSSSTAKKFDQTNAARESEWQSVLPPPQP